MTKKETAVEWFYDKIKSHFEHDGDLFETLSFTMAIAKQKERDQIAEAFNDASLDGDKLGHVYFDQTFTEVVS
jgi:hypothetical protein